EPVQKKAVEAVAKVAKEGGYAAVFDTSAQSLAFFDEALLPDIAASVKADLGIKDEPEAAATK
ncbi:MAG: OmpH family outer membrane protein, partial [Alistipes sp.]